MIETQLRWPPFGIIQANCHSLACCRHEYDPPLQRRPRRQSHKNARQRYFNKVITMLALSDKWVLQLRKEPESGMGYQVVTVMLRAGRASGDEAGKPQRIKKLGRILRLARAM